jgi:hypothetical protein
MSPTTPDTLSRLRAANPARVDPDRGRDPIAQAALERIMSDPGTANAPGRRSRRIRSPHRLAVVLAVMVLGAGGALAATDPLGWWSANPSEAQYGANPALQVATPSAQQIRCRRSATGGFRCTAQRQECGRTATAPFHCALTGRGLEYFKFGAIPRPAGPLVNRAYFLTHIARAVSNGTISPAHAAKLRADLARVPDSFFVQYQLASRFGTYGDGTSNSRGQNLVPPADEPSILVCENAGRALDCQNLNGDLNAPIGAGVYGAQVSRAWGVAPATRQDTGLPPGVHFTRPEYQFLFDMLRYATLTHSSTFPGHAQSRAPVASRG